MHQHRAHGSRRGWTEHSFQFGITNLHDIQVMTWIWFSGEQMLCCKLHVFIVSIEHMTSKLNPNYKLTTHTYSSVTCSPWMFCSCTSWSCCRNVRTFRNWMRESSQRLKDGSRNSQSHWQISLWDYCEIGLRQEIWRHISSRVLLGLEDHCKSCEGYSTIFARHSQRNQVIFVCLKQGTPNPHGLENPFPYGHDHGHDLPHFQPGSGGMPCSHVSLRPRSWYLPLGPGREQKFRVWYVWSQVSNSFNNLSWLMLTGCTVSQQSPAWESPFHQLLGRDS